jgi:hypothetical protein
VAKVWVFRSSTGLECINARRQAGWGASRTRTAASCQSQCIARGGFRSGAWARTPVQCSAATAPVGHGPWTSVWVVRRGVVQGGAQPGPAQHRTHAQLSVMAVHHRGG